ncbi:HpcH/HpaI aldolase/citrate lyase family protein [Streptomyces sp. NPDC059255]|uniref:HpcH/HpaI aldolase family protein n=1 Tax=Streptomyces sp. NPDC059255 TaxID=3346793 RepID=UPI0036BEB23E
MSRVIARSTFTSMIADGRGPVGSFVMSTDAAVTATIASAGYDFVVIDREHGPNDIQSTLGHIRAAEANRTIPIVRVLEHNASQIQASLDAGAHGIIVPKIGSAAEATAALNATRYQPGGRGMCPAVEGARWASGSTWTTHRASSNENVILIPLIETKAGIDNLRDIVAVDGIDFVFFGLADLSQDLGIDMYDDADQLVEIWNKAVEVVHSAGAYIGAPLGYGFENADFGSVESDFNLLKSAALTGRTKAIESLQSA